LTVEGGGRSPIRINLSREVRQGAERSVGAREDDVGLGVAFMPLYGRPRGGEVVLFPQDISQMNRTRATIKALPSAPHRSRPYGC